MEFNIDRYIFNSAQFTGVGNCIGDFSIDGKWFCYSLEDVIQRKGEKIEGETAIPAGDDYKVTLTYSNHFKKILPLVWNRQDKKGNKYVEGDGRRFEGIRLHGGNTEKDSLGCPLLEYNTDGKKIWGANPDASTDLIKMMKEGIDYPLTIKNRIFDYQGHFKI